MRTWQLLASFIAAAALSGCSSSAPDSAGAERIASLEADLAQRHREIEALKAEAAAAKAAAQEGASAAAGRDIARAPAIASPSPPAAPMCFKDYCPCDPPQGGPDTVLCDQLEQGIPVDVQLMIAGRGMREARRQMATGDY